MTFSGEINRQYRRCGRIVLLFAVLFLLQTAVPPAVYAAERVLLVGNGTTGPYFLTGRPLLSDSLVVCHSNGAPLEDNAPILLANPARIIFDQALAVGDTITVAFSALPFSLKTTYQAPLRGERAVFAAATQPTIPDNPSVGRTPTPFKLEINGAKTFGITAGNQTTSRTEQGLQLSVNGKLTETVQLTAAISDRFSDRLTSGASASRLNNLDDFFMAVKSPQFDARLGQLLVQPPTAHAGLPRRLSGAEVNVHTDRHRIQAAAGKLTGQLRRVEFFAVAGRQGPYPITRNRRAIVPQSERVSLDGQLLKSGEDRDYTIDYFTGELTFTPQAALSERSRITVDYEESTHDYLRRAAMTSWQIETANDRLTNHLSVQWEGDDPAEGIGFSLSPDDQDSLRSSGGGKIVRSGAEYVGTERGEYLAHNGDDGIIYEYVGPKNGDYNVRFEYIAPGEGSYVHLGAGAFGYVGDGQGDYRPQVAIDAPSSRTLVSDRLDLNQTSLGSLRLALVAAASQPNRFNRAADRNAWSHDLAWSSGPTIPVDNKIGIAHRFELSTRWRKLGSPDSPDIGIATADIARDWFLPVGSQLAALDLYEIAARTRPTNGLRINGALGSLAGQYRGTRQTQFVDFEPGSGLTLQLSHGRSEANTAAPDSSRKREQWSADQRWRSGIFGLFGGISREDRYVGSSGERFDGYQLGLNLAEFRLAYSRDRIYNYADEFLLLEHRQKISLDGSGGVEVLGLRGTVSASRAIRKPENGGKESRDYLGSANLQWLEPGLGLLGTARYSLNRLGARDQTESFIRVTDGYGDYRLENGLYLTDPAGDYALVQGTAGGVSDISAGKKEFSLRRTYGGTGNSRVSFLANFSAELQFVREEQIDPEQITIAGWLVPWGGLKARTSPVEYKLQRRKNTAQLEHRLGRSGNFWYIRARFRMEDDRYGSRSSLTGRERESWELSAWGKLAAGRWQNWEANFERKTRRSSGFTGLADVDVLSYRAEGLVGYALAADGRITGKSSVERLRDQVADGYSTIYGFSPSLFWRIGPRRGGGSVQMAVEYFFADSPLDETLLPGISGGYSPGHNARVSLNGRLDISGSVSFNLRSTMDYYGQRRPLYRMTMQAVSRF